MKCNVMLWIVWWTQKFDANVAKWKKRVEPQVPLTMQGGICQQQQMGAGRFPATGIPFYVSNLWPRHQ